MTSAEIRQDVRPRRGHDTASAKAAAHLLLALEVLESEDGIPTLTIWTDK
ncbi:hypothetical protein [Catenulispora yoronensis]